MADEARVISFAEHRGRRYMAYLLEQYQKAHPDEEPALVEPHLIARWAIQKGIYNRPPIDPEERLRRELSRYLKTEYTQDPQGRHVRKHHAVIYSVQTPDGIKRRSRWWEIYSAPAKEMRAALQLRRSMAVADVVQLSIDFDSYNENNVLGETLEPMDYNFNEDVAEKKLPTVYPEGPEDDEIDEEIN
jgi:hypothetical protein